MVWIIILLYSSLISLVLRSGRFSSLLSRTTLQRFGFHIRRLNYYTWINNTKYVESIRKDLDDDLKLWRSDIVKLYTSGPGTEMQTSVRVWDGEQYTVEKRTALDLSIMIENMMQTINQTKTLFDNRTEALRSSNVRFIFDNANSITQYFTAVREREIREYVDSITVLRTALLSCKSSIGILAFIFSLIIPYFSYNSFIAR